MKVYHASKARSVRVVWLLEELGLDYELETMPFDPRALKSVDYLEVNPFGKVPVLVDKGTTMSESVAIIQYLLLHYGDGRLEPDRDAPDYGKYLQWMHFGEATLMGTVSEIVVNTVFLPEAERSVSAAKRARKSLDHYASVLDQELEGHDWLVGNDFTAADIVVGYALLAARMFKVGWPDELSNLNAYWERIKARPAFQKAAT